jgi:hypothetical protein
LIGESLRRALMMGFAFVLAAGAGALFLPLAALMDPAMREAGLDVAMRGVFRILDEAARDGDLGFDLGALGFVFWAILIAVCAAPLAFAALVGEIAGARGWSWYVGASGFLAAASPWIARGSRAVARSGPPSPLEQRILVLFFLTGALTGLLYWLIAVRGRRGSGVPAR